VKDQFLKYLKGIYLTDVLIHRIDQIIKEYEHLCPDEIIDIFVSDYVKEDGSREYESLWLFSGNYTMEAKEFVNKDDYDITPIKRHISYVSMEKQDFDFKNISEKSRFKIYFKMESDAIGENKGSKENCIYLTNILNEHILPNLKY